MGNVDTTKREVERHENGTDPHSQYAADSDLSDHESAGNPHSDSAAMSDLHDRYTDDEARNALPEGDAVELPTYASESDLPSGMPEGSIAYVSDTGEIYVEDGT
jgi:uncharacterized phage protein gp47/JayE